MKLIKQTLYNITLSNPNTQLINNFFVEADSFDEALNIAKEVLKHHYEGWSIQSISSHAPLFKSVTKTITFEL